MEAPVREPFPSSWVLLPLTTEAELPNRYPGAMRSPRAESTPREGRQGQELRGGQGEHNQDPRQQVPGGAAGGHALAPPSPRWWLRWMGQHLAQKPRLNLGSVSRKLGADGGRGEAEEAGLGHTSRSTCSVSGRGTPGSRDEGAGSWPFLAQDTGAPSGAPSSCSQGKRWFQGVTVRAPRPGSVRLVGALHLGSTARLP